MHQGLSTSRLGLALVLAVFCLPLFVGLGRTDLETDEAIYSFAVDRMLEIGDWLSPKSSPSETDVFLEKPPLKFWIVAAPIRAGVLPHNEFGLRFWDAVFGAAAFLYVFATGHAMAGTVSGLVAVFLLFVHGPLVFEHGLRTNNMESALVLSYCGGVWHFLRWNAAERPLTGRLHGTLVGLYFVLGFMTKFVAALFLPVVLATGTLFLPSSRRKAIEEWRLWVWVVMLVIGLVVPWFVYAQLHFGRELWDTMLGAHVYKRFRASLNPDHLQPWNFYLMTAHKHFAQTRSVWLVLVGLIALLVSASRRRSLESVVILIWATLPLAIISVGTSKLYHYLYPFLPPLALAAGYPAGLVALLARAPLLRLLEAVEDMVAQWLPRLRAVCDRPWSRYVVTLVIAFAAILAVAAAADIPVRIAIAPGLAFRSKGLVRPLLAILVAAVVAGRSARVIKLFVALMILSTLPLAAYVVTISRLGVERHPLRSVGDCIREVQAGVGGLPPGLYVDTDRAMWHPTYYYLRRIQPWVRQETPEPAALERHLHEPEAWRPSLVAEERYRAYQSGAEAYRFKASVSPPMMTILEYILFLPGPYAVCSSEAALHGSR